MAPITGSGLPFKTPSEMKYDPDHKPSGDAAKAGTLPSGFEIKGAVRKGSTSYVAGDEDAFKVSKPSAADVDRLVASGAIAIPEKK